jgi:hypothetical protein
VKQVEEEEKKGEGGRKEGRKEGKFNPNKQTNNKKLG